MQQAPQPGRHSIPVIQKKPAQIIVTALAKRSRRGAPRIGYDQQLPGQQKVNLGVLVTLEHLTLSMRQSRLRPSQA
ncbi:hypothetical protein [Pseudomonas saudiphocaensis]|uniref:hypothetical protein n=1 Tax=Pseudomonas saudiphocaensis TaxID=1499686 RepID=UPI000B26E3D8|nr:hypothetical protein [Pseudomonas saudiphocaensis]